MSKFEEDSNQLVAITGCTDGIGKALAIDFAKTGTAKGELLIGRNLQKLWKVKEQI